MLKIKKSLTSLLTSLKNIAKSFVFTPTNTERSALSEQQIAQDIQSNNTLLQDTKSLKYSTFIEIILTGNLNLLVVAGHFSYEQILFAWESIQEEFSSMIKTDKSENIFILSKRIFNNRWQISLIDMCLFILKQEYCPISAGALSELGYPLVEFKESREEYLSQIYAIETEAKMLIIQQNQLNNEYVRLTGGDKSPVQRQRMDYEKELRIVSKYVGYRLSAEEISTFEFCSYLNIYIEYVENQKV